MSDELSDQDEGESDDFQNFPQVSVLQGLLAFPDDEENESSNEGVEEIDHDINEEMNENRERQMVENELDDIDEGIEIVNDGNDDDEDIEGENPVYNNVPFDSSLPCSHSYLGADMEDLHGRTIHGDGDIVLLPLFFQPGVVLVPGQILPLNIFHPQLISMMRKVIAADKTFGLIFARTSSHGSSRRATSGLADVGVTCEIFSVKEEEVHGLSTISIKAEGRQRFKILSKATQLDGVVMGKIQILSDANTPSYPPSGQFFSQPHPPNGIRSQLIANHCYIETHPWKQAESRYLAGFNPKKAQILYCSLSSVQGWVYRLYNPYFLMDCLINEMHDWNQNLDFESLPTNPVEFSHWITANLPLTNEMKIDLLQIDCVALRLRKQIDIIKKCGTTLACDSCEAHIADKNDLFSLSRRGPMAAYVNPTGHVHETLTFYKTKNIKLLGNAHTEYSWFPGYAWTIIECKQCGQHMGWKFTAAKKGLNPTKFWGLTRTSLRPIYKDTPQTYSNEAHTENRHDVRSSDSSNDLSVVNTVQYESNI